MSAPVQVGFNKLDPPALRRRVLLFGPQTIVVNGYSLELFSRLPSVTSELYLAVRPNTTILYVVAPFGEGVLYQIIPEHWDPEATTKHSNRVPFDRLFGYLVEAEDPERWQSQALDLIVSLLVTGAATPEWLVAHVTDLIQKYGLDDGEALTATIIDAAASDLPRALAGGLAAAAAWVAPPPAT